MWVPIGGLTLAVACVLWLATLVPFAQSEPGTVAWPCLAAAQARSAIFPSAPWQDQCAPIVRIIPSTGARQRPFAIPGVPSNFVSVVNGSTVTLSWQAPSGGDAPMGYLLEAGSRPGAADLAVSDTGSAATLLVVSNVPAGMYFVRLKARNATGISGASNEIVVTVGGGGCAQAPGAPADLTASVNGSSLTLTWQPPLSGCGPTAYTIDAGSGVGLSNLASFSTGTTATSFSASGVGAGVYYVRVRASNVAGTSGPSNEVQFIVGAGPCSAAPPSPTRLAASVGGFTVTLSWNAAAGATTYVLEEGSSPGTSNVVVIDLGSAATTLTFTAAAGTYFVRVRGANTCGIGFSSNEATVVVGGGPTEAFVVRAGFNGIDFTGATAPDPHIAVGPSSVALVVNWSIVMRDKTGALIAASTLDKFFDAAPVDNTGGFDPRAYFDRTSQRFFVVSTDAGTSTKVCTVTDCDAYILIAVSRSPNPRTLGPSDWYFYALNGRLDSLRSAPTYAAEPVLGFNNDAVVIAMGSVDIALFQGRGPNIRILQKDRMLANSSIVSTDISPGASHSFFVPLATSGTGSMFLVESQNPGACSVLFWGLEGALTSPRLSPQVVSAGGSCLGPPKPEQPGGARPFDGLDSSVFQGSATYNNGNVWVAHALASNSASSQRSEIRWAQLDVSGWPAAVRMIQDSRLSADARSLFYPAIAADDRNNVVIAFAQSGKSEFPSLYFTGRWSTDLRNTLRPSILLKAGTAAMDTADFNPFHTGQNRYGDYFGIALDPTDGSFWVHGEYVKSATEWGTWVSNIAVR